MVIFEANVSSLYYKFYNQGQGSFEGDHAVSSSSTGQRPSIKVLKVINIVVEEEEGNNKIQRLFFNLAVY